RQEAQGRVGRGGGEGWEGRGGPGAMMGLDTRFDLPSLSHRPRDGSVVSFLHCMNNPQLGCAAPMATHSITSSARASSVGGTSRPSALAVFRLITSSYCTGSCTGSSLGFSPFKMR